MRLSPGVVLESSFHTGKEPTAIGVGRMLSESSTVLIGRAQSLAGQKNFSGMSRGFSTGLH